MTRSSSIFSTTALDLRRWLQRVLQLFQSGSAASDSSLHGFGRRGPPSRRKPLFETLEPRLLFSADVALLPIIEVIGAEQGVTAPISQPAPVNSTIAVAPLNTPPVVTDESSVLEEDTTAFIAILANDTDADGDVLSAAIVQGPAHGVVGLVDGLATYTPAANFNGSDSFSYEVTDGHGGSAPGLVSITVLPVNDAPLAVDDHYVLTEDTPLDVPLPGVLGNDTDVDGDTLIAALVTGPAHGQLQLAADGAFTYTPGANYFGPDSFTYRVNDGQVDSVEVATVTLEVSPVNDAPVAGAEAGVTDEDTPLVLAILANDSDVDGDVLSAAIVLGPTHGAVALADGLATYVPDANFNGSDSFTYAVTDGHGGSDTATVAITVIPVNDAPIAVDDGATTSQGVAVDIDVLANDADIESDPLSVASVGAPGHGTTQIMGGLVRYTPGSGFAGIDSFTYDVSDGQAIASAVVTINVVGGNRAPSAQDDAYSVDEDTTLSIGGPGVLANDVDPDGDALTALLVTGPQHGTLALNGTGAFAYTPVANFFGEDVFTYTARDPGGESSTASVHLTIRPVNDAPVFTTMPSTSFVLDSSQTGANRDSVFQVIGNAGQSVDVNFDWAFRDAAFNNEVGIFRVDDAAGRIGTLRPGDDGYANAALAAGHAQVIFASGKGAGAKLDLTLEGGGLYAFYIIQNDTTAHFLASNPQNRLDHGPLAFFSTATANPDGYDHMRATVQSSGGATLAWEDMTQGGDRDFNDVIATATNLRLPEPTPYTYAAGATDVDADPVTYQLIEGPPGATVDGVSGLLTWRPTLPGVYRFVLHAEDGKGGSVEQRFDLEVLRPQRVLFVRGTDNSDKIQISERDGLVRVVVNNEIHAYSGVTAIHVDALAGDDDVQLFGLTVDTLVNGGAGNDRIDGGCVWVARLDLRGDAGNDELHGGAAADRLDGGSGNDKLFGGAGNDVLIGGDGDDIVKGEAGDDTLVLGSGTDTLDGGSGNNRTVSEAQAAVQFTSLPAINWDALAASDVSASAGRSSWIADFVNGMALTEAERNPNSLIRIEAPQ